MPREDGLRPDDIRRTPRGAPAQFPDSLGQITALGIGYSEFSPLNIGLLRQDPILID